MTKVRCPTTAQGLVEMAVTEVGGRAEAATILQCTEKWLYNASNPDLVGTSHEAKVTLEHVRALTRAGATVFAHDLARLLGMELVPAASREAGPDAAMLVTRLSSLMTEAGEALTRGGVAAADGVICARDVADMRREVGDVLRAGYALLQSLDHQGQ